MKLTLSILCALVVAGCASKPPMTAPEWEKVPPFVAEALCQRLRMDALASGTVTIVSVTQPLITPESVSSLARLGKRRRPLDTGPIINRAIPIETGEGCTWRSLSALQPRRADQMTIELSAPIVNPWMTAEAGLFARASLGQQQEWYWIALVPTGPGWVVRFVSVLSK